MQSQGSKNTGTRAAKRGIAKTSFVNYTRKLIAVYVNVRNDALANLINFNKVPKASLSVLNSKYGKRR